MGERFARDLEAGMLFEGVSSKISITLNSSSELLMSSAEPESSLTSRSYWSPTHLFYPLTLAQPTSPIPVVKLIRSANLINNCLQHILPLLHKLQLVQIVGQIQVLGLDS